MEPVHELTPEAEVEAALAVLQALFLLRLACGYLDSGTSYV